MVKFPLTLTVIFGEFPKAKLDVLFPVKQTTVPEDKGMEAGFALLFRITTPGPAVQLPHCPKASSSPVRLKIKKARISHLYSSIKIHFYVNTDFRMHRSSNEIKNSFLLLKS